MDIRIVHGLPFVTVDINFRGRHTLPQNVLLDTGSAGSIFPTDLLLAIGLQYKPEDMVHRIRGVGGSEFVFTKRIDRLLLGDLGVSNFEIEVGAMNYGFDIDGILGMNFLTEVGCIVDLARLEVRPSIDI